MSLTFLTIDEVAAMLKLSRDTVYRLASSGELPGRKVGRAWRFAAEEIEDFVARDFHGRQQAGRDRVEMEEHETGQPETVLAQIADLTSASRCFEAELAERSQAEAFLRAVLASVGAGLIVANENYELLLFNRAAERILGRGITDAPPEEWPEIFGFYLADGTTPCPAIELPLVRAVGGETVEYAELVVRNANLTKPIWLAVKANPVFDDHGHLKGGVAVLQDMTSHRELQELCHRSEQRLSNVLDCLPHMLAAMSGSDGQAGAIESLGEPLAGVLSHGTPPSSLN